MIGGAIGKPIGGIVNLGALSLGAASGVYAITAPVAPLTPSLATNAGAYAISGQASAFALRLAGTAGAYALAGQSAAFITRELCASGAYALNGQGASFAAAFPIASGVYTVGGNAAFLRDAEAAASGAYAIAGVSIALRITLPVTAGVYALVGNAAALTQAIKGAGGTTRRRRGTIPRAERQINVTRDGVTHQVGYVQRFRAPPPLAAVPEWVLQPFEVPEPEAPPLRLPIMAPSLASLPDTDDLAALQDEGDLLDALARLPDPLQEGVAAVLAALG